MHYLDYNEKINHGTPDFPIAFYHVDEHHPRYAMPFHWHKEMELIRILEGSITISLDSVFLTARAGDLILIEEGVIHGGTPEHCVYECAVFDPNLLAHTDACKRYVRLLTRHQIQLYNYFQVMIPVLPRFLPLRKGCSPLSAGPMPEASFSLWVPCMNSSAVFLRGSFTTSHGKNLSACGGRWMCSSPFWNTSTPITPLPLPSPTFRGWRG